MSAEVELAARITDLIAGPAGTFFVIVVLAWAVATKRLVPGWIYVEVAADGKKCRDEVSARAAKTEADLEQLRRDRMGRGD